MAGKTLLSSVLLIAFAATGSTSAQTPSADRSRKNAPAPSAVAPDQTPTSVGKATPTPETRSTTREWPKTLPPAVPVPVVTEWSQEEIASARAQCTAMLEGLPVVTMPAEPMRNGDCGSPAPVELLSVGSSPQVSFSPPAIVTCDMVVALEKWFRGHVQPAAKNLLGSPVVRVEVMSSYSCRTAYGRKQSKLSEHGRANALDIGSFLTERGDSVELLSNWGLTERDIKARIAAEVARKEAIAREAETKEKERQKQAAAASPKQAEQGREMANASRFAGPDRLRGSITDQGLASSPPATTGRPVLDQRAQSRLGGPKEAALTAPLIQEPNTPSKQFLRRVHQGACQTFNTILGPESNDAHRNHFHIDMAERRSGSFCE